MAEDALALRRQQALVEMSMALRQVYPVRELESAEISGFHRDGIARGWTFPVQFAGGQTLDVAVLASDRTPFALPRFGVLNAPKSGTWPHLEPHGILCVFPAESSFSVDRPGDLALQLVKEGVALLEASLAGTNKAEFLEEFVSYWNQDAETGRTVVSLVEPVPRDRRVASWRGKTQLVIAENQAELRGWLERRYGPVERGKSRAVTDSYLLWPDVVPAPTDFPADGPQLQAMLAEQPQRVNRLGKFLASHPGENDIIIGVTAPSGVGFGALRISEPRALGAPGRPVNAVNKGFRPGHVPPAVVMRRALNATTTVRRDRVERADHSWIHGRDHDGSQTTVVKCKVVAVGAGSLGSGVIEMLAKAGIGDLYIVDPGTLAWENLSRHELDATQVGISKAKGLAEKLAKGMPHLPRITPAYTAMAPGADLDWERVRSADLIISTSGNWACDSFLSDLQGAGEIGAVLYGWVEPHIAAAHAAYLPSRGACLRCGMTENGRPHVPVTTWPDGGLVRVPACGGAFTPYGAADLAVAQALIANEVIRALGNPVASPRYKIWVGETERTAAMGGAISPQWLASYGDPGIGGMLVERPWQRSAHCPHCAKEVQAA